MPQNWLKYSIHVFLAKSPFIKNFQKELLVSLLERSLNYWSYLWFDFQNETMIGIKKTIQMVIIFDVLAEDNLEAPYVCDDDEEVDRRDTKLYEYQLKKLAPFPAPEVWDIRVCCFSLERDCVYNSVTNGTWFSSIVLDFPNQVQVRVLVSNLTKCLHY